MLLKQKGFDVEFKDRQLLIRGVWGWFYLITLGVVLVVWCWNLGEGELSARFCVGVLPSPGVHRGNLKSGSSLKDRQQEAERGLRYLTLFSSYCMHISITYIK